jgi:hypothetical protein
MDVERKRIEPSSIADILKFLCHVIVEVVNLKDSSRFIQKTYLLPVQIG